MGVKIRLTKAKGHELPINKPNECWDDLKNI